jgi:hypothetical protein
LGFDIYDVIVSFAVLQLKKVEFREGNSFAFMFACNGRGAGMHGAGDVESALFHKHFPLTPLLGTFTGGEYVHEVLPSTEVTPPTKPSSLEFAYTTVFLFVSYKFPAAPAATPTSSSQ